ncbi:hypothetical protein FACS1894137_03680 [Spirochaetia bacterium]|nr:hypothetical protein FACS1894137_03680 [Spirochaetia bacterium]
MTYNFVRKAITAIWQAFTKYADFKEKSAIDNETKSWLYDAACLLEIVANDNQMLSMLDDYYANPQKLPWNRWVDSLDEKIKSCEADNSGNKEEPKT